MSTKMELLMFAFCKHKLKLDYDDISRWLGIEKNTLYQWNRRYDLNLKSLQFENLMNTALQIQELADCNCDNEELCYCKPFWMRD